MGENLKDFSINIRNICKKYGSQEVLRELSICFKKNTISAILGPSGCGKTTLLNIISGIEKVDSGKVLFNGKDISYIFQEDRLIPWLNVYDNIAFVLKSKIDKKEMEGIIDQYLKLVKLQGYKSKFPSELSGGMKRRVAIARAFAYKSDLLLMDEPFTGLDLELKKNIMNEFLKIWKEDRRTVILVTHDIDEANYMTKEIYFLKEGYLSNKGF